MASNVGERYRLDQRIAQLNEEIGAWERRLLGEQRRCKDLEIELKRLEAEQVVIDDQLRATLEHPAIDLDRWKKISTLSGRHLDLLTETRIKLVTVKSQEQRIKESLRRAIAEIAAKRAFVEGKWGQVVALKKKKKKRSA